MKVSVLFTNYFKSKNNFFILLIPVLSLERSKLRMIKNNYLKIRLSFISFDLTLIFNYKLK